MAQINEDNLNDLIKNIQPSLITPKLAEISGVNNDKKVRLVAEAIINHMVEQYNSSDQYKVPKYIMHDGKTIAVRTINADPLMMGVWPAMSLCLLNLSYGEQTTLIESLYPQSTQLAAKQFAAVFTPTNNSAENLKIDVQESDEVVDKVDSANAGIAMILAILSADGYHKPHPDKINIQLDDMNKLVEEDRKKEAFKYATKRAKAAFKSRSEGRGL